MIASIIAFNVTATQALINGASPLEAMTAGTIAGAISYLSASILGPVGEWAHGAGWIQYGTFLAFTLGSGAYGVAESFRQGQNAAGALGAIFLAYGLYRAIGASGTVGAKPVPAGGANGTAGAPGGSGAGVGGPNDYPDPQGMMSYEVNQSGPSEMVDPLEGKGRISGVFGEQRATHVHKGLDLAAPTGTDVFAAEGGVVTHAGAGSARMSAYGNYVDLEHVEFALRTRYAHLSRVAPGVTPGTTVDRGGLIGSVGSTGRSTGPHLHFEVMQLGLRGPQHINPRPFLPGR